MIEKNSTRFVEISALPDAWPASRAAMLGKATLVIEGQPLVRCEAMKMEKYSPVPRKMAW